MLNNHGCVPPNENYVSQLSSAGACSRILVTPLFILLVGALGLF